MTVSYIGQRLLQAVFVLWLAATLAFVALQLTPGDPAAALLAASGASAEDIAARRAELGLDDPILIQYGRYMADLARGQLGQSWLHGRPVARMVLEQLPSTAELAVTATAVGLVLGLGLGLAAAVRQRTWVDTVATAVAAVGLSTPVYWSGLLAILLALQLPAGGLEGLRRLLLPALVLGFALSGSIARMVRARVVEILEAPFVLAARARGLPGKRVLFVHVLRAAAGPALTVTALQFGFLLGGAVITESVFARRGLGRLAVEAILWQDLPVVRGVVLVGALAYVLVNLGADLLQSWIDPRLRKEGW